MSDDLISRAAAIAAVEGALWRHDGGDAYSSGMDAGARYQSTKDCEAISALPAQPAQGEAVADVVRGVWGRCEALEDEAYAKLESDGLTDHERGFWSAQKMVAKSIRRSTEMPTPITPAAVLAAVDCTCTDSTDMAH